MMVRDGLVTREENGVELRFERTYRHPIERVWEALTDPARLDGWLSVGGAVFESGVGGRVVIPTGGEVTIVTTVREWDPPRHLAYDWDAEDWTGGTIRWRMSETPEGTEVVFTHELPVIPDEQLAKALAGWHVLHDMLAEELDGRPQTWDMDRWNPVFDHYMTVLSNENEPWSRTSGGQGLIT